MARGRPRKIVVEADSSEIVEAPVKKLSKTLDTVRVEMMKRIYVSRDPESTPDTWLHHPDCPPKAPTCAALGCRAVSGLDVVAAIDAGWWNDLPGDD